MKNGNNIILANQKTYAVTMNFLLKKKCLEITIIQNNNLRFL